MNCHDRGSSFDRSAILPKNPQGLRIERIAQQSLLRHAARLLIVRGIQLRLGDIRLLRVNVQRPFGSEVCQKSDKGFRSYFPRQNRRKRSKRSKRSKQDWLERLRSIYWCEHWRHFARPNAGGQSTLHCPATRSRNSHARLSRLCGSEICITKTRCCLRCGETSI